MAKLPKSLIKKYGISKKAWAVFRGTKRTTTKKHTIKTRYNMARHKRKTRTSGMKKGFFGKATDILLGAGIAALYEVFVSPMIPLSAMIKNIIEFAVGLFLAISPRMPMMVRAGGAALATINAYAFLVPLIQGSGSGSQASAWD
jgi:hypothetical protein